MGCLPDIPASTKLTRNVFCSRRLFNGQTSNFMVAHCKVFALMIYHYLSQIGAYDLNNLTGQIQPDKFAE
jgi:hypothetical protein